MGDATVTSVVFHNPPSTPPIKTVLCVASAESTITALTLPEANPLFALVLPLEGPGTSLVGPRSAQVKAAVLREADSLFNSTVFSSAVKYLSLGTLPVAGSLVRLISNSTALPGPPSFSFSFSLEALRWVKATTGSKKHKTK